MNVDPRSSRRPPTSDDGTTMSATVSRGPKESTNGPTGALADRADEEEVDRTERRSHAPQLVRNDGGEERCRRR